MRLSMMQNTWILKYDLNPILHTHKRAILIHYQFHLFACANTSFVPNKFNPPSDSVSYLVDGKKRNSIAVTVAMCAACVRWRQWS